MKCGREAFWKTDLERYQPTLPDIFFTRCKEDCDMYGYGGSGFGMGYGMAGFGLIAMILFLVAVVAVAAGVIRWLASGPGERREAGARVKPALTILEERYARGQIDKTEFDQKRKELR